VSGLDGGKEKRRTACEPRPTGDELSNVMLFVDDGMLSRRRLTLTMGTSTATEGDCLGGRKLTGSWTRWLVPPTKQQ
jgi:hypothetical protein